ncbi:callose synthase 9-like [Carica papaya]|uniref:callose synthase 9-like n=1 Tax=Carica papaya TaxID=3649 RepID=UPI000B8CA8D2|nr:callose synthase 9-like [Carica papaya]
MNGHLLCSYEYEWSDAVSFDISLVADNHNALTVASLWAPVIAIYLLDIHIFYTIISAVWGFLLGARDRLGEIRSLDAIHKHFGEFPGAFMRTLHIPLQIRTSNPSSGQVNHMTLGRYNFLSWTLF